MEGQVMSEASSLMRGTFDSSMNYMNLGFTLVAALAWADLAKRMSKSVISQGGNRIAVMYPIAVTLLAVLVLNISKRVNPNTKRPVVVPVVSA